MTLGNVCSYRNMRERNSVACPIILMFHNTHKNLNRIWLLGNFSLSRWGHHEISFLQRSINQSIIISYNLPTGRKMQKKLRAFENFLINCATFTRSALWVMQRESIITSYNKSLLNIQQVCSWEMNGNF